MLKLIKTLYSSERFIGFISFLWLVTMPIRGEAFSVTIKFEIYPNLIVTLILLPIAYSSFKFWNRFIKSFVLFLLCWAMYGLIYTFLKGFEVERIFDLRSLFMQLFYAMNCFGLFYFFKEKSFANLIKNGLRFYLVFVLVFGLIEFFTHFHLVGFNVLKLTEYPISSTFYAPFFILDSNNDFCVYLALLIGFLLLFDEKVRNNPWLVLLLIALLFVFSRLAQARLSEFVSFIYFLIFFCTYFYVYLKQNPITTNSKLYIVSFFLFLTLIFVRNDLFDGMNYYNSLDYQLNSCKYLDKKNGKFLFYSNLTTLEKKKMRISYLHSLQEEEKELSFNIRKNLNFNAVDLIVQNPVLGVGPGGFRIAFREGKFKHYVGTVFNPHNFLLEIVSEFGIFAWLYCVFFTLIAVKIIRKKQKNLVLYVSSISIFIVFMIVSIIPSSFLYLDLQWLFLPLLIIISLSNGSEEAKGNLLIL